MDAHITHDLDFRILTSLRKIIRAVDIYSRKLNSDLGLTTPQLLCLYALDRCEELTLTGLANEVNLGASTVIGIVDRLESKGFAHRNRSDKDRRKVHIEITSEGQAIVKKAPSLLQDKLSESFSKLELTEQEEITKSLEKIVSLMEVSDIDASPNLIPDPVIGGDALKL